MSEKRDTERKKKHVISFQVPPEMAVQVEKVQGDLSVQVGSFQGSVSRSQVIVHLLNLGLKAWEEEAEAA